MYLGASSVHVHYDLRAEVGGSLLEGGGRGLRRACVDRQVVVLAVRSKHVLDEQILAKAWLTHLQGSGNQVRVMDLG